MLIYTSGTTGLPKAGTVVHSKMAAPGAAFGIIYGITHEDRLYTTLPLYHTAGGMIGIGMHVVLGCTMVLRSKFSASSFMQDCAATNVTVAQYIGELCRYLLATPPTPADKQHCLRIMVGNGLRPDIWQAFVDRFALAEIGEFYGATEGNVQFFNHWKNGDDAAIGAIGRAGSIMKKVKSLPDRASPP
jgi:acyl-CoA synthetase (AMP-forming)/AMP-acid ligase II